MIELNLENSRAILIGASEFPSDPKELPSIPPVEGNVEDMAKLLADQEILGLPQNNIQIVLNERSDEIQTRLFKAAREASDTLIVYYSGHGIRHEGDLYLTAYNSEYDTIFINGINFNKINALIERTKASKRVLILDCCYSGLALQNKMGVEEIETHYENIDSTYVIASSPSNRPSIFKDEKRNTEFTSSLIDVIKKGVPNSRNFVSLEDIYSSIHEDFRKRKKAGENIFIPTRRNKMFSVKNFVHNSLYKVLALS